MIRKALNTDCKALATLHKENIPSGFLSSLPIKALEKIYLHILEEEIIFVNSPNDECNGFISASMNTENLFSNFAKKHFIVMFFWVFKKIFTINFYKKIIETFLAPKKMKIDHENLEIPELLSIVVSSQVQANGIGFKLLKALENHFLQNRILQYKVLAGENLISANSFYQKNGFELIKKVEIHKGEFSNLYLKNLTNQLNTEVIR